MTSSTPAATPDRYDPALIEPKWQQRWAGDRLYETPDADPRDPYYLLTMFPYTSGDLHIGHWFAIAPPDVVARYQRMRGHNVLFPIGFDAFGLPAENAAIRDGTHPRRWTYANVERMRAQLKTMGASFDWSREIITSDPEYYRWTQWLFLQLLKHDLAYRAMAPANWCPSCQTVLANEQVLRGDDAVGRCERCESIVEMRDLEQWFFRITQYAEELLDFSSIEWPERIRAMQTALDRPLGGHRDPLRAGVARGRRRRHHGLHDARRHGLRHHVDGAGPGASAGGADHDGRPARRGGGLRAPHAPGDGDRAAVDGAAQDGRRDGRVRAAPPSRARASRSGSRTTCC